MKNLLTIGDAKTSKGEKLGYKTAILYMAPHKQNSKGKNLCPFATEGCAKACLFTAGRGKFSNVQKARINKSEYFLNNRELFMNDLFNQISKLSKKHENLVIRLNGTTDIPFENITVKSPLKNSYYTNIFEAFPNITFYDYTKNPRRVLINNWPNYHLTFSRAETKQNQKWSSHLLELGFNVATVFEKSLFEKVVSDGFIIHKGRKINVVNGDLTDLRFLDGSFSIIALKAKGDANKDISGFVVRNLKDL